MTLSFRIAAVSEMPQLIMLLLLVVLLFRTTTMMMMIKVFVLRHWSQRSDHHRKGSKDTNANQQSKQEQYCFTAVDSRSVLDRDDMVALLRRRSQ